MTTEQQALSDQMVNALERLSELKLASTKFLQAMHNDHVRSDGRLSQSTKASAEAWAAEVGKANKFMLDFAVELGVTP